MTKAPKAAYVCGNQIVIECNDGSMMWVNVGNLGADIIYAPNASHYPEPMVIDDKGRERYPTDFTPHPPLAVV